MKKIEETTRVPGLVLMIWRAGRMVLAEVCSAPETRPSTSPRASIMVPSQTLSSRKSAASSMRETLVTAHLDKRLDVGGPDFGGIDDLDLVRQVDFDAGGDAQDFLAIA